MERNKWPCKDVLEMDMKTLQNKLAARGCHRSAELLPELEESDDKLAVMAALFEDCAGEILNLSGDLDVLYAQVSGLHKYESDYEAILLWDIQTVLQGAASADPSYAATLYMDAAELDEAVLLYQHAMAGDPEAQVQLGHFYKELNHEDWAIRWYEMAAAADDPDALYWLGNGYFTGNAIAEDWQKAFECYKKAAHLHHPDAMNNYADMYLRGEYVEKDEKHALDLFLKAAELGVAEAMYTLGYMHENGVGTTKNVKEAAIWFKKSALAGDVFAANRLGHEAVANGHGAKAVKWYRMAADRGDAYGEYNLGVCYEVGIGVPSDLKKAKYWFTKAALKGDKLAKEKLEKL